MKVRIKDIIVGDRARGDFGDLLELSQSLKDHGLIQPIVVDSLPKDADNPQEKYRLIAGERRLRAAIIAGWSKIHVTLKSSLTNFQVKAMELEENIKRLDMSWEERCEAEHQLHELKQSEKGKPTRTKEGWGVEDTAKLLNISSGTLSEDIKLAKQLKEHPELKKKVRNLNKSSAKKLVEQTLEARDLVKRMKDIGVNINFNFQNLSCEDGIRRIPSDSIHCLITDPPFALDKIAKVGDGKADKGLHYNTSGQNVGSEDELQKVYEAIIPELYRVMKAGAHFYIFLGFGWYCRLTKMLRKQGFIVDDQPIIWDKMRTTLPARGAHYTSCYEAILFGHRPPQKRIILKPTPNILHVPALANQGRVHPMQKPFDLLKILIENSSSPGEIILDCFAGSGSTIHAAQKLQRVSRGFEKDEGNYLRALKWLTEETKDDNAVIRTKQEVIERIEK